MLIEQKRAFFSICEAFLASLYTIYGYSIIVVHMGGMMVIKHSIRGMILSMASILLLSACSNTGEQQNHSQHQAQQEYGGHEQNQHMHPDQKKATTQVDTQWQTTMQQANQTGEIHITVKDKKGKPISDVQVSHEQKMHLIAVSEDLSYFAHLHPKWKGNGHFAVKTRFPHGGKYSLYADFIPQGGSQVTAMHDITIQGESNKQSLQPDTSFVKTVDGKEVSLAFAPKVQSKQETQLTFTLKEEQTKAPITNLEPYLGAVGHVVIISQDRKQYLHVHPLEEKAKGPEAKFSTIFPHKGLYKIWGQFQHQGKILTVSFVVHVSE